MEMEDMGMAAIIIDNIWFIASVIGFIGGVIGVIYSIFFGFYFILWILDYNGVTENHVENVFDTLIHWMQAFERIDILGYPIRLGKLFISNL